MTSALDMLDRLFFGNSIERWALALGAAMLIFVFGVIARRFVRRYYARMAQTTQVEMMEIPLQVAARTATLFLCAVSLFAVVSVLETPEKVQRAANTVLTIAICWQIGLWISTAALAWIDVRRERSATTDRASAGTLSIISVLVRGFIWSVVLLLTLDNLGVNITTLVAGLGVGGIAIALAVQNVLGDLFASLSIALDKPFVVGDFLIIDDFMGSVEYIGIKSVRLRSLSGEQIVMSNADLLSSRLRNYGRMQERRVVFPIGVTYSTPRTALKQIPTTIREIVNAHPNVRFDRCHLAKFGAYSIDFECVYYVLSADYNAYMDIQQDINLRIHEAFEKATVEFAYPTQTVLLAQTV